MELTITTKIFVYNQLLATPEISIMVTQYPAQIDTNLTLPTVKDNTTPVVGSVVNRLRDAIIRIEAELGIQPASVYSTVRYRLDLLENALVNSYIPGSIAFYGDLRGNNIIQTVVGLQGNPIAGIHPTDGYVLTWVAALDAWIPLPTGAPISGGGDNAAYIQGVPVSPTGPTNGQVLEYNAGTFMWTPTTLIAPPPPTLSGDITGVVSATTISKIHGTTLSSSSPVQSAVIVYDTADGEYDIRKLTLDDLGPAFEITSFSGGAVVEVGATVTNPAFTASYSSTPGSAQITNTFNIDSPLILSPPYTNGTVIGSFTYSSPTVSFVQFTLTATAATTQTANQFILYEIRDFGGVGTAGATSSVTATGSNAILSTGDIIFNQGLFFGGEGIGTVFGPFSPSAQKIYLLLQGGSHTFKDANTGFAFPFNTPTTVSFTNQNGVAGITLYLYESQFNLSATYSIEVAS